MFAELIIASEAQQDVVEAPHIPGSKKVAYPFDVTARSFIFSLKPIIRILGGSPKKGV